MARKREKTLPPNCRVRGEKAEFRYQGRVVHRCPVERAWEEYAKLLAQGLFSRQEGPVGPHSRYGEVAALWLDVKMVGKAPNTQVECAARNERVRSHGGRFWDLPLREINPVDADLLKANLLQASYANGKRYSPSTIDNTLAQVRQVLNWAMRAKAITYNPAVSDERRLFTSDDKIEPVIFTDDQFNDLLEAAEGVLRAPIVLGLLTGIRAGEARGLLDRNVLKDTSQIKVEWQLSHNKKTGGMELKPLKHHKLDRDGLPTGARTIDVPPMLIAELERHVHEYGWGPETPHGTLVFRGPELIGKERRPGVLWPGTVHKYWKRLLRDVGLPDSVRLHDTRHNALSHIARNIGDPLEAQGYAGHRQLQTTMTYLHAPKGGTRRVADLMGARVRSWTKLDNEVDGKAV